METQYIALQDVPNIISREKAKGYKSVVLDSSVKMTSALAITSNEDKLLVTGTEGHEEEAQYMFVCKEFGLIAYNSITAKVHITFCDNGLMLVTLLDGALILRIEDENGGQSLIAPNVNLSGSLPSTSEENVYWVNADKLMSFAKYWGEKSSFIYDFEFALELRGDRAGGVSNFKLTHLADEDIDISAGAFAMYLKKKEDKEQAKRSREIMSQLTQPQGHFEFDDDDTLDSSEESDVDDEDGGDDDDDFSDEGYF